MPKQVRPWDQAVTRREETRTARRIMAALEMAWPDNRAYYRGVWMDRANGRWCASVAPRTIAAAGRLKSKDEVHFVVSWPAGAIVFERLPTPAPIPMTPPVRPEWAQPDAYTLEQALALAKHQAEAQRIAQVICVNVRAGDLTYDVMQGESYAKLKAQGAGDRMAPICSVLPNGRVELYAALRGISLLAAVQDYGKETVRAALEAIVNNPSSGGTNT